MNGFWLLFRREIERRWTLLLAPILIGLIVAVLPWFDVWHGAKPGDVRGVAGFVAAFLWAIALAVGMGLIAWPGDLRARRLSFDFRLPARGGTIWAARVAAGLVLTMAGSGIILLIPSLFGIELKATVESLSWMSTGIQGLPYWSPAQFVALLVAAIVILYLAVQVLAISLAGNRLMSVVAVVAILVAVLASWLAWEHLSSWFAVVGQRRLAVLSITLAIVGLAASLAWQALRGRSESDRSQRKLLPALVIASLAIIGCAQGYASWYLHPSPSALHKAVPARDHDYAIWGFVAAKGKPAQHELGHGWTLLEGVAWGRPGLLFAFAKSNDLGRTVRLGPSVGPWVAYPRAALSADGTRLAWPVATRDANGIETALYTLDAARRNAMPHRALVALPRIDFPWALSPDGRRIVSLSYRGKTERLLYDDVDSGKLLKSFPIHDVIVNSLKFTGPNQLTAIGWTKDELQARFKKHPFTIDLRDGSIHAAEPATSAQ